MWKILSWVAVGLLAVAAFFSYKNVKQFRAERTLLEIAKSNSQATRNHLKQVEETLAADKVGRRKTEDERDALVRSIDETKRKTDALSAEIAEKKKELENVMTRWAEMRKVIPDREAIIRLKTQLAELTQEKANRQEEVSHLGQQIAIAIDHGKNLDQQALAMRTKEAWQAQGVIEDSFRSRIRAVDNNWGFAVIDGGNRSGVTSGATLEVRRGGSVIGQLRVTNVEQNRSVADIVKGSVAEGNAIRPGDLVTVSRLSSASQWRLNQQAIPAKTDAAPGAPDATQPGTAPPPGEAPPAPVDPFADPAAPPPAPAPPTAPTDPAAPPAEKPPADPFGN